eukprot:1771761-Alexandrium_andersonii.AAC.1
MAGRGATPPAGSSAGPPNHAPPAAAPGACSRPEGPAAIAAAPPAPPAPPSAQRGGEPAGPPRAAGPPG